MTFTEIVQNIQNALNLTSSTSTTRISASVNRRYRRITASIGMILTRRTNLTVPVTLGSRIVTISGIERVVGIFDQVTFAPDVKALEEISYEDMQEALPRTDRPTKYAIQTAGAGTVTIFTDFNPQAPFNLYVEGEAQASILSGSQVPAFDEDFHDILEFGGRADELRKMEKTILARDAEADFERRLSELRYFLAVSAHRDLVQGGKRGTVNAPFASSGSGSVGGGSGGSPITSGIFSWTQTGLITFDRTSYPPGSRYPFAVAPGSEHVVNLLVDDVGVLFTDNTTGDVTSAKHGFAPKALADATKFLNSAATPIYAQVKDSDLSTSNVTTNDGTTAKHGFIPKAPNDTSLFWRGDATYANPFTAPIQNAKLFAGVFQFRLTLGPGNPYAGVDSDIVGQTSVWLTPVDGNAMGLYDGAAAWNLVTSGEITIALVALTNDLPYDVFVYNNAGVATLELLAWASKTARATALVWQDGVLVKSGATTRRYVGSFHTTSATTTEDSAAKRLLYSYYNQIDKPVVVKDTTATWTYAVGATWRQARASAANQFAVMQGWTKNALTLELKGSWDNATNSSYYMTAFGEDSTTTPSPASFGYVIQQHTTSVDQLMPTAAGLRKTPAVGYHYYAWLEYVSGGTANVYGFNAGAPYEVAGIHGMWKC